MPSASFCSQDIYNAACTCELLPANNVSFIIQLLLIQAVFYQSVQIKNYVLLHA